MHGGNFPVVCNSVTDKEIITNQVRVGAPVLNTFVDALSWDDVVEIVLKWAASRQPRTVCLCNVHSAVTALDNSGFANALKASDMVLPDGAPIAWMLRQKGFKRQTRIAGPDLVLKLCEALQYSSAGVFLFGSSEEALQRLQHNLKKQFPGLTFRGALSPRFGVWSQDEASRYADTINRSGAEIIFVGLGCPRQELWMAKHSREISGVLLGVGAAFDFHAGTIRRAPEIMQIFGLEWLHRLISEPKRLWRRYLVTNSSFLWFAVWDIFKFYLNKKKI